MACFICTINNKITIAIKFSAKKAALAVDAVFGKGKGSDEESDSSSSSSSPSRWGAVCFKVDFLFKF